MEAVRGLNVGHALAFRADKLGFLLRCARQADVVELKLGRGRTYLLSDPIDIRHVLVTEEPRFPKNPRLVDAAEPALFGEGLVGSSEADHRSKRLSLQPVFDPRKLQAFADVVVACADELLDTWTSRRDVDVVSATVALAHRVRMRVLLGDRADDIAAELVDALTVRQRYIGQVFVSPVPYADRLPSRTRRDYRRGQRQLERLLLALIGERRREGTGGADLLAHLLEMREDDGTPVGDQRVFDEARGFLASYELSGRGLAWTLCLLAEHRDVQTQLARELDATDSSGTPLLGYAQMVYSEALRLYPPTWLFVRMTPDDVQLPSGRLIPAGSRLFLCPYTSQRDPRFFPDPERFDPERFRPGPATRARPRSSYFPFGGGRHVCIGEGFVRLEAALVLSRLARGFELTSDERRPVPFPGVTLEPRGGVRLRLRVR
jgi:pentalenene oxygenase